MRLSGSGRRAMLAGAAATFRAPRMASFASNPAPEFQVSFIAGARDPAGHYMGGTEMRLLTAHGGKIYAGNGYWEDRPGLEGRQGAQIFVLDGPGQAWRVDHTFDEMMANFRPRDLAVGALAEATFATDGAGAKLSRPVSLLLASTWDLTGATRVFTRDDTSGAWTAVTLTRDPKQPDFLPQIRAFGMHRDRATGVDLVFAGEMPRGIFAGGYDPWASGRIRWNATPELDAAGVTSAFSGLGYRLRVSSFAEANGRLYAAVGQQMFERIDGPSPRWRLVYTNPRPGHSETGLRGLTSVPTASGGEALLAAVEGNASRIVRIDPANGAETTELDLQDFLGRAWGMRPAYVIAAYNDMARVRVPGGEALLIGLQAFVPRNVPVAAGHTMFEAGDARAEAGAWYLVHWPDGRYDLRQVTPRQVTLRQVTGAFHRPLIAPRAFLVSPFPNEAGMLYVAGYDAIKAPAHDTAWIARAPLSLALGAAR